MANVPYVEENLLGPLLESISIRPFGSENKILHDLEAQACVAKGFDHNNP